MIPLKSWSNPMTDRDDLFVFVYTMKIFSKDLRLKKMKTTFCLCHQSVRSRLAKTNNILQSKFEVIRKFFAITGATSVFVAIQ